MNKSITPTIGRKVWYFPSEATALVHHMQVNDPITPLDASICYVWHDNMINISVADHAGKLHAIHNVTLIPTGQFEPEGRDYCVWMPYQAKQAAKEAREATALTTGEAPGADAPKPTAVPTAVPTVNSLEQAIRESGADKGPRVRLEDVLAHIKSEHFFTAAEGVDMADPNMTDAQMPQPLKRLTICVLVLQNDFTVTGISPCVSTENFNAEIGRRLARERAVDQVWMLLGYELRNQVYRTECLAQAA
jgi:hypothetical protein